MSSWRRPSVSVADYRRLAQRRLPRWVFDYLDGGAEDEIALRHNRTALDDYQLIPSVLRKLGNLDTSIELFGRRLPAPMLIAPTGLNGLLWPEGDIALAKAATAAGLPFILSTAATSRAEHVAEAVPGADLWLQLYVLEDRSLAQNLMRRAQSAGYRVLVLTVDVPMSGKRERDMRNGFKLPFKLTPRLMLDGALHPRWSLQMLRAGIPNMPNLEPPDGASSVSAQAALLSRRMDLGLCWDDLAWLRDNWQGPVVLKGLGSIEDAVRAAELGVDGIVFSNHGGRQLDAAPAPIQVLEQAAAEVGSRLTLMVDSGFRRGGDIAKARALGADAVLLGRATLYGLAASGEAGATAVLELLQEELRRVMILMGCARLEELTPERVVRRQYGLGGRRGSLPHTRSAIERGALEEIPESAPAR